MILLVGNNEVVLLLFLHLHAFFIHLIY